MLTLLDNTNKSKLISIKAEVVLEAPPQKPLIFKGFFYFTPSIASL
ncbi:hypothetical protein C21_04572 [Arenibacter sp. NBRC 103722]|nr:hypothetical protein C21_04572 [Arenibacter sp. NBRC 103722]